MSLFGKLIDVIEDVVTLPLDVVEDIADTLEGEMPTNTRDKIIETLEDGVEGVSDGLHGDIL